VRCVEIPGLDKTSVGLLNKPLFGSASVGARVTHDGAGLYKTGHECVSLTTIRCVGIAQHRGFVMRAFHRSCAGLVLVTALVAASCGSDDDSGAPEASVEQEGSAATEPSVASNDSVETDATTAPVAAACGVLEAGIPEDFDVLDPHIGAGETPATWLPLVYETLVGVDKAADITDGLATDWSISDDGLTYTFNLRQGVTFHNGEMLDSSHVKWNLDRIIDPETAASSQSTLAVIDSVETPDPATVVLNLSEPSSPLISALAQQQRVGIMHPDSVGADGAFAEGIGTGPFTFVAYSSGDRLQLDAYQDYWGDNALLEGVEVRIIPDATARLNALSTGDIDFAWAVPAEDAASLAEDGSFQIQENIQNRGNFFSINIDKPPFDNPKLREAMQLAVSRSDIAAAGWNGFAVETMQPYNETSFWYLDKELRTDADLETARSLVQEAGAEGTPVTIVQWDQLGSDAEAQIVASAWNDIGLDATIEKASGADLISQSEGEDWDVIYLWIGLITDPVRAYNFLYQSDATRNGISGGIQSDEMDQLLTEASQSSDPDERKALYSDVMQINLDLFAQFYTVRPFGYVGVGNDVTGFEQGVYYVQYQGGGMSYACVPADD